MIEELCLAGGSHRGIAYIGTLHKLEEYKLLNKKHLKKIIGTSIGSFVSACYLIKDSTSDLLKLTLDTKLETFNDISLKNNEISILKGNVFKDWVRNSVRPSNSDKDITLKELHDITNIHFIIVQTCLEEGLILMDHINSPDVLLYQALIASMSIPFIFPPCIINNKTYVDGGILENFPVNLLTNGNKSFGIRNKYSKTLDISTTYNYINKIIEVFYEYHRPQIFTKNLIYVDTIDFSFLDFNISIDDKVTLFKRGQQAVINFFLENDINEYLNEPSEESLKEPSEIPKEEPLKEPSIDTSADYDML